MKKLVLLATAAAFIIPNAAFAKDWKHHSKTEEQHYTYKRVDNSSVDGRDYRIELKSEENFRMAPRDNTFTTLGGERLQIDGKTVYKITEDGQRFFAPNGSYETRSNQVVVVEDGQLKRLEVAPNVYLFDADLDTRRM